MTTAQVKKHSLHLLIFIFVGIYSQTQIVRAEPASLFGIVLVVESILNALIPVIVGFEVLYFFWTIGVAILHSGSENGATEIRQKLVWGVVAIFVTVSVWGIIQFFSYVLGTPEGAICPPPQIQRDGVSTCID
jgi:hypothetical protein